MEAALERKSPRSKTYFALLLNRARVHVGIEPEASTITRALEFVGYRCADIDLDTALIKSFERSSTSLPESQYLPDAQVLAEAIAIGGDYFVTFDGNHLLGQVNTVQLPFPIGTAGDFLAWYREWLLGKARP